MVYGEHQAIGEGRSENVGEVTDVILADACNAYFKETVSRNFASCRSREGKVRYKTQHEQT